jgi:hypothetical protein
MSEFLNEEQLMIVRRWADDRFKEFDLEKEEYDRVLTSVDAQLKEILGESYEGVYEQLPEGKRVSEELIRKMIDEFVAVCSSVSLGAIISKENQERANAGTLDDHTMHKLCVNNCEYLALLIRVLITRNMSAAFLTTMFAGCNTAEGLIAKVANAKNKVN